MAETRKHKDLVTQQRQAAGIKRTTTHPKRRERRERASVRQGIALRDPKLQLKALDERLGKGVGATKERARLQRKLEQAKADKDKKGGQS